MNTWELPFSFFRPRLPRSTRLRCSTAALSSQFLEQRINLSPLTMGAESLTGMRIEEHDQADITAISVSDDVLHSHSPVVTIHVDDRSAPAGQILPQETVRFRLENTNVAIIVGHDQNRTTHHHASYPTASPSNIALLNSLGFHVDESVLATDVNDAEHDPDSLPHWLTELIPILHHADEEIHELVPDQDALLVANNQLSFVQPAPIAEPGVLNARTIPTETEVSSGAGKGMESGKTDHRSAGSEESLPLPSCSPPESNQFAAPLNASSVEPKEFSGDISPPDLADPLNVLDEVYGELTDFSITLATPQSTHPTLPVQYFRRIQRSGLAHTEDIENASPSVPAYPLPRRNPQTASMAVWLAAITAAGIAYRSRRVPAGRSLEIILPVKGSDPASVPLQNSALSRAEQHRPHSHGDREKVG